MTNAIKIMGLLLFIMVFISCGKDEVIETTCEEHLSTLKLNEYQIIGSHNSYRQATTPEVMAFVNAAGDMLPEGFDPASWDYTHEPILDQLNNYGVRSLELDVYRDPQGGLFSNRYGNAFVGLDPASGNPALDEPGLKVLHFPDFDYNSHYTTFIGALNDLKTWSASNPNHLAITVLVEAKEDSPALMLPDMGLTESLFFVDNSVEEIEEEINEVFSNDMSQIIRPDDVRKSHSTLRHAIEHNEWPSIDDSRGKIIFVLMARDEVVDSYIDGYPSLVDRSMFVFTDANKDESAYLSINDPAENYDEIRTYVSQGFMVRTQADSNTYESRSGDYNRMNMAFDSGAQIISTDYYRPDPRFQTDSNWTNYTVKFPANALAIINQNVSNVDVLECMITD